MTQRAASQISSSHLAVVPWGTHKAALSAVRFEVFVEEQNVPIEIELDDKDPICIHILATSDEGEFVGCGRLLPDGHIGRMAVRKPWRGQGVGRLLLEALLDEARRAGHTEAVLSAQLHAIGFYEGAGFIVYGPVYEDAGIPHRDMRQAL